MQKKIRKKNTVGWGNIITKCIIDNDSNFRINYKRKKNI